MSFPRTVMSLTPSYARSLKVARNGNSDSNREFRIEGRVCSDCLEHRRIGEVREQEMSGGWCCVL
jgi:hypothetical protein